MPSAAKRLKQLLDERRPKGERWHGVTGNFDGTISVPDKPGFIYVRVPKGNGFEIGVFAGSANTAGMAVEIEMDPITGQRRVVNGDAQGVAYNGGGSITYDPRIYDLPVHHARHELGGDDEVNIYSAQILPLQPTVTSTAAPRSITVGAGLYQIAGVSYIKSASSAISLDAYYPAAGVKYVWVLINSAGTLSVQDDGATVYGALVQPSNEYFIICIVQCRGGYGIAVTDILDHRYHQPILPKRARGSVVVATAVKWAALDNSTSGNLLIGNGTDIISTAMAGDATITSAGTLTLASITTAGTFGDATHVAQITVDAKGRIVTATNVDISAGAATDSVARSMAESAATLANTASSAASIADSKGDSAGTLAGTASSAASNATASVAGASSKADSAGTQASTASSAASIADSKAGSAAGLAGTASSAASIADSKGDSAGTLAATASSSASLADSKSGSAGTQAAAASSAASNAVASVATASSKADSAGTQASTASSAASIADSKGGSSGTLAATASSAASIADSKAESAAGGGPGGADTNVQYNDGGSAFGGDANLTWDKTLKVLGITGDIHFADDATPTTRAISVDAQAANNTAGNALNISAGKAKGTSAGGAVTLRGGDADSHGEGGDVILIPGTGIGATNGTIKLNNPVTGINGRIDTSLLNTLDKTFTLPNSSGTFALTTDTSIADSKAESAAGLASTASSAASIADSKGGSAGTLAATASSAASIADSVADSAGAKTEFTTIHTTTLLADHIGEHTGAHNVVADNILEVTNNVKFPAVQVASADANTLDDYEEGTWTPDLQFGGAKVGITYGTQTGTYTKIGNLVHLECSIVLTSKGSSVGNATLAGVPFAAANISGCVVDSASGFAGLTYTMTAFVAASVIYFLYQTATGRAQHTDTNFTNTSTFRFGLTYRV